MPLYPNKNEETLILRSSVSRKLKRLALFQGFFLALIGAAAIVYGGAFLSLEQLKAWGFPIFILGFAMIAAGLLPYRKLCKLEMQPEKLAVIGERSIEYHARGKRILSLSLNAVLEIKFYEKGRVYGIGIDLKQPVTEKICIHWRNFNIKAFLKLSKRGCGSDLFFPYFSRRSASELKEWIHALR